MLTIIYWGITLFVLMLVLWNYFEKESTKDQFNAILIIIPFVLRILFIK